jgi:hypothetical protein
MIIRQLSNYAPRPRINSLGIFSEDTTPIYVLDLILAYQHGINPLTASINYSNIYGMQKTARSKQEIALMIAGILIAVGMPVSYAIHHTNMRREYLEAHPEIMAYSKALVESKSPEIQQKIEQIVEKAKAETPPESIQEEKTPAKEQTIQTSKYKSCDITPKLVRAIIDLEYDPRKEVSSKGATGRMQIMRRTWDDINKKSFGGKYPYVPYAKNAEINIKFGTQYLKEIKSYLDSHKKYWKTDQLPLIFACYIGGWGNIKRCKFDPELIKSLPNTYDYMQRGSNLMGYEGYL